ncbi:MAG: hypothetical protein LC808_14565, partial [Actinobacteria bacterium]|nr:hypothetical protein [Actinomycetota bacterium]
YLIARVVRLDRSVKAPEAYLKPLKGGKIGLSCRPYPDARRRGVHASTVGNRWVSRLRLVQWLLRWLRQTFS